jgi:uncharacterized protein YjbK
MPHLEVETKFELTAAGFERLKSAGSVSRCEEQLNVYYDAEWRLADISSTLRIRFFDASAPILTLKIPVAENGDQRVMREFEVALRPHELRLGRSCHPPRIDVEHELPQEFGEWLLVLGVKQVERMGWVRNTRVVLNVQSVGQLELDRLELPDGTVIYEAEIESRDDCVHERLARFVCRYAPDAKPSRVSKFQRFRKAVTSLPDIGDAVTR